MTIQVAFSSSMDVKNVCPSVKDEQGYDEQLYAKVPGG